MDSTHEDRAALERVVARTGHTRFRALVARDPDYWRAIRQLDVQGRDPRDAQPTDADAAAIRRAAKPRVPLGVNQRAADPECVPCRKRSQA